MPLRPTEPRTVVRNFGPVWIWREDLAEIVSVMRQVAPELTLRTDGYTLDDVEDLAALREGTIATFAATSADSRIRLVLGPREAMISADDPDLRTRGMLEEVVRVAIRHDRPRAQQRVMTSAALAGIVLFFGAVIAATPLRRVGGVLPPILLVAGLLMAAGSSLAMVIPSRRLSIIRTQTRAEAPLWFTRNRDALITNAIVSALFLVIGILIGYLLPD